MTPDLSQRQRTSKPPSAAQTEARMRNFRVFKLRGLHAQLHMLTDNRRAIALAAVDAELETLGAESETARRDRERAKYKDMGDE